MWHFLVIAASLLVYGSQANINLSREKVATQSSDYKQSFPAGASKAVDGNTNGNWNSRTCSCTNLQKDPWWQVDLYLRSKVSKVIIYNRMDCCSERLDGVKITVGDDPYGGNSAVCGEVANMRGIPVKIVECTEPLIGRYVRLTVPGWQYLTLCEVEVIGEHIEQNLARGKHAAQSSNYLQLQQYFALNAVDGITDSTWFGRSCSCTKREDKPWWRVDLGHSARVNRVVVYNRMDCCSERLSNFHVKVGDGKGKEALCGEAGNMKRVGVKELYCTEVLVGSTVEISLPGIEWLTLCEVHVIGEWDDQAPVQQDQLM